MTSALDDLLADDLADPAGRTQYEEIAAMVDFGVALSIARDQRKCSFKSLADATGIPRKVLLDLEKGNAAPTLLMQRKIAQALGVRIEIGANGQIEFALLSRSSGRMTPRGQDTRLASSA